MIQLSPVTHGPRKNRFCGPAALSAITGMLTDDTARLLRQVSGRRQITGTSHEHMLAVLAQLGYRVTLAHDYRLRDSRDRPTFAAWYGEHALLLREPTVFLLSAGNHWQVVSSTGSYVCGISGRLLSVYSERVKRRARVKAAWIVERVA